MEPNPSKSRAFFEVDFESGGLCKPIRLATPPVAVEHLDLLERATP